MKKTLYVLLIIPFVVAILTFVNIVVLKNTIGVDIIGIDWSYADEEGFQIRDQSYQLEATPIIDPNYELSEGNDLVWSIKNKDGTDNSYATLTENDGIYYLKANLEGYIDITCSNRKNTVSRTFSAQIFKDGAIIINNAQNPSSGQSISNIRNYGQYDLMYGNDKSVNKIKSSLTLDINVLSAVPNDTYYLLDQSVNVAFENGKVNFIGVGQAFFTLAITSMPYITSTYSFNIVEDGINVYNYQDLLECTNKSNDGEIVCLQTNLQSLQYTYQIDANGNYTQTYLNNNTKLFGNYDFKNKKFSFKDEIYRFTTTYNHEYIDQYVEQAYNNDQQKLQELLQVKSAVHVQKDFYGNGYTINTHEVSYPTNGKIDPYSGKLKPGANDLFQGPLTFVSLGKLEAPIVETYGQDNSGMYIEGNDITIDDLKIQNTNDVDNLYNLEYVGSVIDTLGNNITISNSIIRNGRVGLRVFSSPGFVLNNSMISNAREFLLKLGSNRYVKTNDSETVYIDYRNNRYSGPIAKFMNNTTGLNADVIMDDTIKDFQNPIETLNAYYKMQNGLDNQEALYRNDRTLIYEQEVKIIDSIFYTSGLFAIGFDTNFNGPYLYNGLPSFVKTILSRLEEQPIVPNNIGGTSYPTNLIIEGDTRFYDYKDIDSVDLSCLIQERFGEILHSMGYDIEITIDQYFPVKKMLKEYITSLQHLYAYQENEKNYINTIVAYYGGGNNLSNVDLTSTTNPNYSEIIELDYAYASLTGDGLETGEDDLINMGAALLARCVPMAAGFNPFKFITNGTYTDKPYLYGETPNIEDLYNRGGN